MLKAQKIRENYENFVFKQNQHILQRITEAVLLCGEQENPLRGHREQDCIR